MVAQIWVVGLSWLWKVNLPSEWLEATEYWEMRFVKAGVSINDARPDYQYVVSPIFLIHASNTSAVATDAASAATASSSNLPSPAASLTSLSSEGLKSGAKAGIGIGVALGALLLVALGFLLAWLKFRGSKSTTDEIAEPPTKTLLAPPAFTSQQNIDKSSLRAYPAAETATMDLKLEKDEEVLERSNLFPGISGLDGVTIKSPVEMPDRRGV